MATTTNTKERFDLYRVVTDEIVAALEAGTVPWQNPWDPAVGVPRSIGSSKPYRGVNVLLLGAAAQAKGYSSPWWGTYKAIGDKGGQVRKGEHATLVVFWKTSRYTKTDEAGEDVERRGYMLRYYKVFNLAQADGLDLPAPEARAHFDAVDEAEAVYRGYKGRPALTHGGSEAFYEPSSDRVQVPAREAFDSAERYYSTLFHELTHSTGHASRLDRWAGQEAAPFGCENYSKEELVAEMGAAMLTAVAGLPHVTVPASAAYLASWIRRLQGDSKLIVHAAAQAQHAADRILGVTFEKEEVAA